MLQHLHRRVLLFHEKSSSDKTERLPYLYFLGQERRGHMSIRHHSWHPGLIMLKLLIACILPVILQMQLPNTARAATHASKGPTMQVDVGFNEDYREGYWTPVYVTLNNSGPDFHGMLS